ncbi:histidine--tRNA ligase [Candidatus Saccharibacteria bacterium]|nr:histidine--tRNA ligase [Candidatus Saccharibacteria bacterium]NCS83049.1 histidine--tRNA ligase [Candidatus Saccharibacteria bacterium]
MTRVEPRRPGGFAEFLPGEQIAFNAMLTTIRDTYEKYGYAPLDTPDLERTEVLLAKGGGETEQQVYSFTREGSKTSLTLRYDLTVPLARYVAEHESDLTFPFRRYHIGKVHRAERQQKGRFREFYQCDIDVIGSESPLVDAEFPAIINEIFESFNFGEFTIRLNNRMILTGFFEGLGLRDVSAEVLRVIDKIDKLSGEAFVSELSALGLNDMHIARVHDFIGIRGSNSEILEKLKTIDIPSEQYHQGVAKLAAVIDALQAMGIPESRYCVDLRIARGLDYYTSTVYETTLDEYPDVGSVCSGGRYDNLADNYTKTELPGVGISIGLSRLFAKLREIPGLISVDRQSPANVIVVPISSDQNKYAIEVSALLRGAAISTVLFADDVAMKKKFRYADKMGFAYVVIVGDDEVQAGTVSLKDMETGDAKTVSKQDLIARLK